MKDTLAELLAEICKDVKVEPMLLPVTGEELSTSNTLPKKHGIVVVFTSGQNLKQKLAAPKGQKLDKQGVTYSVTRRAKLICTKNEYLAEEIQYIMKTMMLNGYPKTFVEKEIKKTLKIMESTPHDSNKEKTEGIAKLFLPYERGYGEKIKRIAKKHGIDVVFTRGQNLKQKLAISKGQKLDKQGVVYSVKCKNKRCKMEYIGQTGRQLKCPINKRT